MLKSTLLGILVLSNTIVYQQYITFTRPREQNWFWLYLNNDCLILPIHVFNIRIRLMNISNKTLPSLNCHLNNFYSDSKRKYDVSYSSYETKYRLFHNMYVSLEHNICMYWVNKSNVAMLLREGLVPDWIKLLTDMSEYSEFTSVLHHPWCSYM